MTSVGKARRSIKKGDILISVPFKLCIDSEVAESKFSKLFDVRNLRTGDLGLMALYLLTEKLAGERSKYFEYVRQLPSKAPGALAWNDTCIKIFVESTTRRIATQIEAINQDYKYLSDMRLFDSKYFVSIEEYIWAIGTIKARSFYLDGKRTLVPGTFT